MTAGLRLRSRGQACGELDEDRGDAFGRGATGYGVRMLVELAARLAARP